MPKALKKHLLLGMSVALLLTLSGCTGSLKMPVNEYSHVSFEATPLKSEFEVAYHLYESLPHHAQDTWRAKIKLNGLGTVYDSNKVGSPAATRIEEHWERLWLDGRPGWSTIEGMLMDKELTLKPESKKSTAAEIKIDAEQSPTTLPLAGLSGFMFSSKPDW